MTIYKFFFVCLFLVIGDEILKGHVQDTNSNFLCQRLFQLGVKVNKVGEFGHRISTSSPQCFSFLIFPLVIPSCFH